MKRRFLLAAASAILALTAACGEASSPATGQVVEIFGPYQGREADLLAADLESFAERTGIEVRYTGSVDFVADLRAQVFDAADPPDVALVPQRGLVAELTRAGRVVPVPVDTLVAATEQIPEDLVRFGEVDGVVVGIPFRVNVKSLVWYRPSVFADLGVEIPSSLDELEAIATIARSNELTPWCMGIEAQQSTGWVATDWTEEMVLRLEGPDVYDQWSSGTVPFSDERIAGAYAEFSDLVLSQGSVRGGISGVLRTPVRAAHGGLLTDPPGCVLYRQANFAIDWMPGGLEIGPQGDLDVFVLPAVDPDATAPVLIGLDLAVAFDDRPAVSAVLAHLASPAASREWVSAGGFIPPHGADAAVPVAGPVDRRAREILVEADIVRLDASDAMPPAVGAGLLWSSITDWVAGTITYEQLATAVDDARAEPS